PDYFSAQGQRWGNPIYDWDALRARGYRFCIDRVRALLAHVDAIRLDHFRGFAAAWHVPFTAPTAQSGEWNPGPGGDFFRALQKTLGGLPFLAEDLGIITPDVSALRDEFHLPGTRVLQFAFDGHADNPHLPENYMPNVVAFTGTHDNPTTRGWYEDLPDTVRGNLWRSLNRGGGTAADVSPALLRVLWSSVAALAIAPLQDILNLGKEARMNQPGRAEGNWRWRTTDEMFSSPAFESLRELTRASARSSAGQSTRAAISMSAALRPTEERRSNRTEHFTKQDRAPCSTTSPAPCSTPASASGASTSFRSRASRPTRPSSTTRSRTARPTTPRSGRRPRRVSRAKTCSSTWRWTISLALPICFDRSGTARTAWMAGC